MSAKREAACRGCAALRVAAPRCRHSKRSAPLLRARRRFAARCGMLYRRWVEGCFARVQR